jgi:hypothetical protein
LDQELLLVDFLASHPLNHVFRSRAVSLDLPYVFLADGEQQEMELDKSFDFGPYIQMAQKFATAGLDGLKKLHEKGKARRQKRRNRWKSRIGM